MGRHAALRELRSLERQSMYSIFAPLDPDERLPRELLMEGRRYRQIGRRELAGALWLPALCLLLALSGRVTSSGLVVLGAISLMYGGFWAFILLGKHR